ncbi:MAG: ribosomal protein S18-alanine N-acetyltransferase [Mycobacteriales bacterium]
MTEADLPALLPIERDLFGHEAWSEGLFRSELAEGATRTYLVAEQDGQMLGYGGLVAYPDDAWVQTLAVRRDCWGQGVGAALLEELLADAARRGRETLGLEVRADNARAQQLYRRYGFRDVAIRRGYYQPSNVDAVIMQRGPGGP